MKYLLSDKNSLYFNPKYPIIYRTKIPKKNNPSKYFFVNAIDNAIKNNQSKAVDHMIEYIVKY